MNDSEAEAEAIALGWGQNLPVKFQKHAAHYSHGISSGAQRVLLE